jgi:LuxR family maltose regulon positive regulatory protein
VQRLAHGLTRGIKLFLLAAPAGFGKSTLLVEWLAQHRERVAWLALDEGDNDPARFLAYFVAALRNTHPALSVSSGDVSLGSQQASLETVLIALLNDLVTAPERILVVLDDYHVIHNETIHRALAFFLEHLPPHVHLVVASRSDPLLPIATLRARGRVGNTFQQWQPRDC